METSQVDSATVGRSPQIPTGSGNTFVYLVRFALANIGRRPERFVLSVVGIALAIACVTIVRTISAGFATTGADSIVDVLDGAQLWVVPAAGVHYDADTRALIADGPAPALTVPAGWTARRVLSGIAEVNGQPVSLRGITETASDTAVVGSDLAARLDVHEGDDIVLAGHRMQARIDGSGESVTVPTAVAEAAVGDHGWWVVTAPPNQENSRALAQNFSAAVGLPATADPAVRPEPDGAGLIYDTVGGSGPLNFEQKYSALFSGKVTGSALGLISTIGLALGFVIAVSSFLAAVTERRREFGIMSSIGLADEVLYFFLVESAIVFLVACVLGIGTAGIVVALVVPGMASVTAWLQAAALTAMFLPAMAIVGALVPVHRLLQQRPVTLLGGH
ncbi:ABC transporter permease [Mycobacterium sp. SMC-4]|uniref:ABC transporter permease n=1 Tax=Mycobacterium sp. SMC-4 TaxID=2857059 RepID=UPI003D070D1E